MHDIITDTSTRALWIAESKSDERSTESLALFQCAAYLLDIRYLDFRFEYTFSDFRLEYIAYMYIFRFSTWVYCLHFWIFDLSKLPTFYQTSLYIFGFFDLSILPTFSDFLLLIVCGLMTYMQYPYPGSGDAYLRGFRRQPTELPRPPLRKFQCKRPLVYMIHAIAVLHGTFSVLISMRIIRTSTMTPVHCHAQYFQIQLYD